MNRLIRELTQNRCTQMDNKPETELNPKKTKKNKGKIINKNTQHEFKTKQFGVPIIVLKKKTTTCHTLRGD